MTEQRRHAMKENQFRNKVYWFTFIYSILVVWVHSYNSELFLGRTAAAATISQMEHFIGEQVAQIAVPGFFMISAYLFYRNFSWEKLGSKWSSRIRSVLVPFLLWNGIYYLGYVIASRLPFVTDVVGKGTVPFHLMAAADAILHHTYNYVFWYLYQLLLLILLAPVIYAAVKNRFVGAAVLLIILVIIGWGATLPYLNLDALLYYSSAAYIALHGKRFVEGGWNKKTARNGLLLFVGVLILSGVFRGRQIVFTVLVRLIAPMALWLMVSETWLFPAKEWMKYNFFLYATHFAFVRLINKTAAMMLPDYPVLPFLFYLMMPGVLVLISYLMGILLRQYLPRFWCLLNGDR